MPRSTAPVGGAAGMKSSASATLTSPRPSTTKSSGEGGACDGGGPRGSACHAHVRGDGGGAAVVRSAAYNGDPAASSLSSTSASAPPLASS